VIAGGLRDGSLAVLAIADAETDPFVGLTYSRHTLG